MCETAPGNSSTMSAVLSLLLCGPVPGACKRLTFQPFSVSKAAKRGTCAKLRGSQKSKAATLDATWVQHSACLALLEDFKSGDGPDRIQIASASVAQHVVRIICRMYDRTLPWLACEEQVNPIRKHSAFGPCSLNWLVFSIRRKCGTSLSVCIRKLLHGVVSVQR